MPPLSTSSTSIASARSRATVTHSIPGSRKVTLHWWQRRPVISNALFTDLQKGSYFASIFTLVQSVIQIIIATFDAYCLLEARKGSKHFRSFGISFLFVYSGNEHIRRTLIACSLILIAISIYLLVSSVILMNALRKEHEIKFKHWIRAMALFIVFRVASLIFQSIANDIYFFYHQFMLIFWTLLIVVNVFMFLVVISNFQELSDITRLEDMAKLKMSTLSSLNASRSLSHHSLDSYRGVNSNPSPNVSVQGTPATPRGSTSSGGTFNYPQPSPRTGYPTNTFPLSAFGFNLNPSGSQPSPKSQQGSIGGGSYSAGRGSTPSTVPI
ncbi:uncharacterized protein B4U79_06174 [Dinothrombium tinctorium]|uniref:Uncharacterized protein n=1 Tax=Dinothrombium tinctorium TaxID=1965070 RepID=A0A3S3PWN4_9ACAR|nr:uncharacterized protein B4U79_15837 [Dinothrombium tinctorium]RWS09540.1 uncharacterized protein B4U79_14248 [Dinothrombium tinctorium]RWS09716.1 uncharacterized protein B4U79_06174 [Dinothrombium tinctorium]